VKDPAKSVLKEIICSTIISIILSAFPPTQVKRDAIVCFISETRSRLFCGKSRKIARALLGSQKIERQVNRRRPFNNNKLGKATENKK